MNIFGWLQLALFIVLLFLLTKPVGIYLTRVLDPEGRTFLDAALRPVEQLLYRLFGLDPKKEQAWQEYTLSLMSFSLVSLLFTYAILRIQHLLPLNPQGFGAVSEHLAFNTAVSFTTNTNWQSYGGETTLSYLSQMVGLVIHNFISAAAGIAVAAAFIRGIARHSTRTIGNFWVDLVRVNLYLLLPACIVYACFLVSQGTIQNFRPYDKALLVEPAVVEVVKKDAAGQEILDAQGKPVMEKQTVVSQTIAQGPAASQIAIKMLGTNGGGFFNSQCLPSVRESYTPVEFSSDPLHFPHPERPDLYPGTDGEKPGSWVDRLGGDAGSVPGGGPHLLVGRIGRQPENPGPRR